MGTILKIVEGSFAIIIALIISNFLFRIWMKLIEISGIPKVFDFLRSNIYKLFQKLSRSL